jgi:hypothetical protein
LWNVWRCWEKALEKVVALPEDRQNAIPQILASNKYFKELKT